MCDTHVILADKLNVPMRSLHVEGAEGLELGSAEGVTNKEDPQFFLVKLRY